MASLEQVLRNTHLDLRESMIQFQEYSQRFPSNVVVPAGIITDIRRTYKEIQDQLTKIRGIHQLLESRYRQYYRRDSIRDKEISEFGILAKNLYTRFESALRQMESATLEERKRRSEVGPRHIPAQWFRSEENQILLLRNLQDLYKLDYKAALEPSVDRRQRTARRSLRSLSLFILSGEAALIGLLHCRMRIREYDIKERYAADELRGALAHLREISSEETERIVRRFMDSREVEELKGVLFSIQSEKDLGKELLSSAGNILKGIRKGEVKTIAI